MAKKKQFSFVKTFFVSALFLVLGFAVAFVGLAYYYMPKSDDFGGSYFKVARTSTGNSVSFQDALKGTDEFSIHFIEPATYNAGDIIYIKAGNNDILIDSGAGSASTRTKIINYLAKNDCMGTDKTIEYLIVTHAHGDHYGNLTQKNDSLFNEYKFGTIIDFALTNQSTKTSSGGKTDYQKYLDNVANEVSKDGAVHYTARQCFEGTGGAQQVYTLGTNISMEILYNKYYFESSTDENNYSVCTLFTYGNSKYLLTGDLEAEGETAMINYYNTNDSTKLEDCVLYKANHHGSYSSSSAEFLSVVKPRISVATCCAGSIEYVRKSRNLLNSFPSQTYIENISSYTNMVYCPSICTDLDANEFESLCGDIVIRSNSQKIYVECSNEVIKLKDSNLFQNFEMYGKTLPQVWEIA